MPIKLKPFQKTGVKLITKYKGVVLLADDMRLGKTVQTLTWLFQNPSARPAVVVCPSIAKWEWYNQAKEHYSMETKVLDGTTPSKKVLKEHSIFIVNYEVLHHWVPYLKMIKPKVVIMDECHYIKNRNALRTTAVRRLTKGYVYSTDMKECNKILTQMYRFPKNKMPIAKKRLQTRAKHIIAISGTPLVNRPIELFPALNILWPKEFNSFVHFGQRYCQADTDYVGGLEFKGAINLGELHERLKGLGMIRRLKKDVIDEYTEPTKQPVLIDIQNEGQYNKSYRRWYKSLTHIKRKNERYSNFLELKQQAAELKLPSVITWIEDFFEQTDEKLVVFAHHKKIVKAIKDHFKTSCVVVDGSVSAKKKVDMQKKFANDKTVRLFIGNIKACGMAVSLKVADTVAFAELPLTPGDLRQCEDRVFDLSKKNELFTYYLVAKGTIEETVCKLLQRKQSIISDVLDGQGNGDELTMYSQIEQMIKQERTRNEKEKVSRRPHRSRTKT